MGSFCVRSLAALIVLALLMLIAAIWVRCGLALAGLGPPLDDAMLFGCSWGSFSIFVVVQLLPGVSSCVCEPDVCLHFCFPGSSGAFDTMKDLVGLFICSCVCGCLHVRNMQVLVSSGAFEFTYVLALFFSGSRVGQSSCALLGCGFCTWTAKVAFCEFVLLRASPLLPRLAALRALLEATAFSLLTRCWPRCCFLEWSWWVTSRCFLESS